MRCLARFWFLLPLLSGPPVLRAQTSPAPQANPGRPTVSTPATLTPVGYFQFETGFTGASHSGEFDSLYNLNEVIKFSVTPRVELLAAAGPITQSNVEGTTENDVDGAALGAQAVLYHGEAAKPTLAVSYLHEIYNGSAPDFDVGSPTNSFLLLASADVKGFHYDANLFFNELVEDPVRRAQYGQSLSISHPLSEKFTVSGEIWRFTQPFLQGNAVGTLWAVGYTPRETLVFDAGFNRGLTDTSTRWEIFAGFTYVLPHRLWRDATHRPRTSPKSKGAKGGPFI